MVLDKAHEGDIIHFFPELKGMTIPLYALKDKHLYDTKINDTRKDFPYFQSQLSVFRIYSSLELCIRRRAMALSFCKMLALKFTFLQCQKGQNEAQRKPKGLQGRECL